MKTWFKDREVINLDTVGRIEMKMAILRLALSVAAALRNSVGVGLRLTNLPAFIGKLGECQLLSKDITHILESVRQTVVKEVGFFSEFF